MQTGGSGIHGFGQLPRVVLAAAAGLVLVAAFPPYGIWPAVPVSVAMLVLAARGGGGRGAALLGLVHGLGFFVPLLHWSGVYVGPVPWLILATSQALFHALLGVGIASVARLPGWPLWTGAVWVAEEALRARLPFSGFPWGRLAFGLADSPYLHLAVVGGAPLMAFAAASTGGALAWAAVAAHRRRWGSAALGVAAAVLAAFLPVLVALPTASGPAVTVAVVQGNVPRLGLDFNSQRREVLNNHVQRTRELAARVRAGQVPRPNLVLWPENSSDVDPFRDAQAYQLIDSAVRDLGVPVVVGALVEGPGRFLSNTGVVWDPRTGPRARYVKREPVPFAEYIPMRPLARLVSDKVDLVARAFAAGSAPGRFDVGGVRVGDVICFEVGDDGLVRDAAAGTGLLAVQTNNATFGFTPQTEQQLALSRVRAVEHARPVLVAATSGVSAVVAPDGTVAQRAELFTPAVLVATVPTAEGATAAARWAPALEAGLATLGILAAGAAMVAARRRRSRLAEETSRA